MKKIIAILPMKGNSERVPNKNMKEFNGKPLYHAVVNTLLISKYIDKLVIDTDSDIIKEDAIKSFGSRVIIFDRPKEIQGDFVSMNDIIEYDLSKLEGEDFLQTHSTNPLLRVETLDRAIECYFNSKDKFDSIFSVTKVQTRFYNKNAEPINHNSKELLRTQDLEPMYEENSNFYIFSKESFAKAGKKRIGINPKIFEMNKLEAIDIDEPEDFELAELLYQQQKGKK